jgi:beta-N-acetylhexosaminidase
VRNAGAFNEAMRKQGIASCGKHFPGYSAATIDAHEDLPKIDRSRAELDRAELGVFRKLIRKIDSMMICHGWYPVFEKEKTPASLSRRVVTDLLCQEMHFEGLIMTDDLDMGAILNEYSLEETIRLAMGAGNDLAMICHRVPKIEEAHRTLEKLPRPQIDRALSSVARFKKNLAPPHKFSDAAFRKIDNEIWELRAAVLGEERARERSAEDGKRSPVETY